VEAGYAATFTVPRIPIRAMSGRGRLAYRARCVFSNRPIQHSLLVSCIPLSSPDDCDQIDALQTRLNLKVVYVLANPGPAWEGERGYITADVLQRHLPKQFRRMQFFVCGPTPMMDAMEKILPEIGVPAGLIHTERFEMA
jgi:predicted ferric reductase